MKIYLDTKDLINVFEKSNPFSAEEFNDILRENNHELILSFLSVVELSAPLFYRNAQTNVAQLLNNIEKLPVKYISNINKFELKEALNAFAEGREYTNVFPFFDRFDYTVEDDGLPPTHVFLNYPLSEIVFDLWAHSPSIFQGFGKYTEEFRKVIRDDRSITSRPSLRDSFVKTIRKALHQENMLPSIDLTEFAYWIYDKPERCPSIRLGYEVCHKIIKNVGDIIQEGDIPDFGHIHNVPYVDLVTLDRRMHSYTTQASRKMGMEYQRRLDSKLENLMNALISSDTASKEANQEGSS